MKTGMSRRSLLAGAGYAVAGTSVGQMLAAVARAQDAAPAAAGICMTMLFMQGQRAKFNDKDYVKKHLPLLRQVYGDSVERIELRMAAPAAQGIPPSILATATLWVSDVAGFSQKLGANAQQINKEIDAISNANRMVQVDRIGLELGEARSAMTEKTQVYSLYYPSNPPAMGRGMMMGPGMGGGRGGPGGGGRGGPGGGGGRSGASGGGAPGGGGRGGAPQAGASGGAPAAGAPAAEGAGGAAPATPAAPAAPPAPTLDSRFFIDTYLPKLYSLYGTEAVRRLEATLGQDQGGQKPAHLAAYHVYIKDRGAYDGKTMSVVTELQKDSGQFTTIFPTFADMRLTAVG